jgi:hypothetical protein
MTLETLFTEYRTPLILLMFATPWVTFLACRLIPGQQEEPFLLSANLALSVLSLLCLSGYLAYVTNTGGWQQLIQQADIFLLVLPLYHLSISLWLSQFRMPLHQIPAFRTLQGIAMMGCVYLIFSWLASRIYIVFFSFMPFNSFLIILAAIVGFGYMGYRKIFS